MYNVTVIDVGMISKTTSKLLQYDKHGIMTIVKRIGSYFNIQSEINDVALIFWKERYLQNML